MQQKAWLIVDHNSWRDPEITRDACHARCRRIVLHSHLFVCTFYTRVRCGYRILLGFTTLPTPPRCQNQPSPSNHSNIHQTCNAD